MITEAKLNKMYDVIIDNQNLTSKKLAECRFNPNEVATLLNKNILTRDENGIFHFQNIDELFNYGKRLLFNNEDKKASKCFEKCVSLNCNVEASLFNLFYLNIKQRNYEKAFSYFKQNYGNENYINDDNYYLYLLSNVTNFPNEYKQIVEGMTYENICTNDERQNEIRLLSLNKEFELALEKCNALINSSEGITFNDVIIKTLLESSTQKFKCKKQVIVIDKGNKEENKEEDKQFIKTFHSLLNNKEISYAVMLLEEYLNKIGKGKYIPIVINLIELHLINRTHPTIDLIVYLLKRILNETYYFPTDKYVKHINNEIYYNRRERIIFYLNILKCFQEINIDRKNDLDYEKPFIVDKNNIIEFIDKYMSKLRIDGILCLKIPNKDIMEVIDKTNDLDCLITVVDCGRIIIRYAPFKNDGLNFADIYQLGESTYHEKKYEESIEYFKQLLSFKKVNANIYLYLGLAYLKTGYKATALNYLITALKLDKTLEDFMDFIRYLKSETIDDYDGSDKKEFKMLESDFNHIYNENMDDIIEFLNDGLSFDDACQNLDENTKNLVALNLAIDNYIQGEFEKGDNYLKKAKQSKQKSDVVRERILEIEKNKRFYQNRLDENYKPLIKKC